MSIKVVDVFAAMGMDLKGYRSGLKQAEAEAEATGKKIDKGITVRTLLEDLELGRKKMLIVRDAGSLVSSTLKGASANALNASLNVVKGTLGTIKNLAGDVVKGFAIGIGFGSFQALGNAISDLVGLIPNLIEKGKQYGLVVDQISDATGASAEEASRLAGTLLYLGAPVGSIVSMLGQMSRNLEENEERLNALGITTRDQSGALLNQVQILENARQALNRYGDGTAKADLIAREFGRGGLATLVDYLQMTDEQAKKVTDDLEAQGLIISESQRQMAETAQREGNRFQNALTGLGVTLFTVVGPQITAFFSDLSTTISTHAAEISAAISEAVSFILGLVGALAGVEDGLSSFSSGMQKGDRAVSPYSAHLLQLNLELADLDKNQRKASDGTDAQRRAIQRQIDSVDRQISALKRLEAQQDRTYRRALEALNRQLDAQDRLLDAEERRANRADRDAQLARALTDAKRDLLEAEAQLAQDRAQGRDPDRSLIAVSEAQRGVVDAQKAIADEAADRAREDRRAQIDAVRDYLADVAKIVEESENKKALLVTLKKREALLEERRLAAIAAGDLQTANDYAIKLEAVRTAEERAQQQLRNGNTQSALEKKKASLQAEKAAVRAAVVDETAVRRREIQRQIADLQRKEAAWKKTNASITADGKKKMLEFDEVIRGNGKKTGVTGALNEAREAGVKFGKDVKAAMAGLVDIFKNIAGFLTTISKHADSLAALLAIAKLGATNPLTLPFVLRGDTPQSGGGTPTPRGGGTTAGQKDIDYLRRQPPNEPYDFSRFGTYDGHTLRRGMTNSQAVAALVKAGYGRQKGGWVGQFGPELAWLGERGREAVLDTSLSEKLDRYLNLMQARQFAPVAAAASGGGPAFRGQSGTLVVERLVIELGGTRFIDLVDQQLKYRRR